VTKLRVLSRHQQLIRLDFEDGFLGYDGELMQQRFLQCLPAADVVVFSDYAKGTLRGVQSLIQAARAIGKPVLVDPKGRDFTKYRDATLLTPNVPELEAIVGPCEGEEDLCGKGERLRRELRLEALLITRGEHGMTLLREGHTPMHLRARAREVYDVTGAGDTAIAVLAASIAAGEDMMQGMRLANLAAGIVVGKLGAATVSVEELREALSEHPSMLHGMPQGIADEEQLLRAVQESRSRGEILVMTNGCFDLLHAGHVHYLEQARALGDRLIVAVNDDASVRRLKGPPRPVNPLAHRMKVLAGLTSVDWVVPFSEDTPEQLICRVLPDVLVKGGDYRPEQIAGSACVAAHGGRTVVLDYLEGCSTSAMLKAIRRTKGER
jgi:D-beta-D-heptose 7-phosphate kinase/D-beta-D-heptose 1-phosphate adenosyltransferase